VHDVLRAIALIATAGTITAAAPITPRQATTCFDAHHVIATPLPARLDPIPPAYRGLGVLDISFALVRGQELDHARLLFQKNAATALRLKLAIDAAQYQQAGNRPSTRKVINEQEQLVNNVIVLWTVGVSSTVHSASKRTVTRCLSQRIV
jgi:hypothetical protein